MMPQSSLRCRVNSRSLSVAGPSASTVHDPAATCVRPASWTRKLRQPLCSAALVMLICTMTSQHKLASLRRSRHLWQTLVKVWNAVEVTK